MAVKINVCFTLIVLMLLNLQVFSQKQVDHEQQVWVAYNTQSRFSDKWGLWADFHLRTKEDFLTDLSTSIARVGLTYYAHDNLKFTAGYAYVNHFPQQGHTGISLPEHRPWQQVQWHYNTPRSRLMQWVRLEERYRRKAANNEELADGYNFSFRVRYAIMLQWPLSKNAFAPGTFSFTVNDELHINMGKQIVYNYFDQNRFFAGLAFHVNPNQQLQFGYSNVFVQTAAGNRFRSLHVPRIFYFQNFDFRKNRKP